MVNEALCKGCGACAAACPCEAPMLMGFNNRQMYAQIKTAFSALMTRQGDAMDMENF